MSNFMDWASAQPIWLQVFIGLVLFFVGLPLVVFLIAGLFNGFGELLGSFSKSSKASSKVHSTKIPEKDTYSDELLMKALLKMENGKSTEQEVKTFLSSKRSAEKSALKKNPKILRVIQEIDNEVPQGLTDSRAHAP